ncbi:MAG: T9SS type A sorting domain-containing protein [Ignavibacteria bacterium]|nr:T9SS type A sorting domain-containing protein [Ignavibacteria bacterium]
MAVGWDGTVITTTNGGANWVKQNSGISETLYSLHLFDFQNAIACGMNGKVYRSTNAGTSWTSISIPNSANYNNLFRIRFINNNIGWFVGEYGTVYKTTNGGSTWTQQTSNAFHSLFSIFPLNENIAWIVGGGGTILKTTDGGVIVSVDNKTEIPPQFSLLQNYPNPFNPATVISYQLTVGNWVTLKVYDLLGREIAILVNEYKQPGNYNCEFKIENGELPSGVYLYNLRAGNISQTKKMLLLK